MKKGTLITLGLIAGAGAIYISYQVKEIETKLSYSVSDLSFDLQQSEATNFKYLLFVLIISITNPVSLPIPFVKVNAGLNIDGHDLGAATTKTFTIPANSTTKFSMNLYFQSVEAVQSVLEIITGSVTPEAKLTGKILVPFTSIALDQELSLKMLTA